MGQQEYISIAQISELYKDAGTINIYVIVGPDIFQQERAQPEAMVIAFCTWSFFYQLARLRINHL